jgi:Zn-dependent protease with chaperone function
MFLAQGNSGAGDSSFLEREVAMGVASRAAVLLGLSLALPGSLAAQGEPGRGEKVDGYAEWRVGDCLVADGQRVCPSSGMKFSGGGEARSFATVPLGYELKAEGTRRPDGTLVAKKVEAKPNGSALFEGEIRSATDQAEERARKAGRFLEGDGGRQTNVGRLHESGPQVDRVRRIVDTLLPPYVRPEDVRVYVIENKEWNAFAMGNHSFYVFTGLLDAMDDDEVAIILGHELVHATHEHSRKQMKREMWVQLAALGVVGAAGTIDDDTKRAIVQLATGLAATAYSSGYGRGMEDQADRVGLRYAYEAGYDITKGPRLWNRFAKKYGEGNKVANFFFSDHSQSAARAAKLEKEIAFNYPEGPKPDGPRTAGPPPGPGPTTVSITATPAGAPPPPPASTRALTSTAPAGAAPAAPAGSPAKSTEIRRGMSVDEVRRALGEPESEIVFAGKSKWTYRDLVVVFENGRVSDVQF